MIQIPGVYTVQCILSWKIIHHLLKLIFPKVRYVQFFIFLEKIIEFSLKWIKVWIKLAYCFFQFFIFFLPQHQKSFKNVKEKSGKLLKLDTYNKFVSFILIFHSQKVVVIPSNPLSKPGKKYNNLGGVGVWLSKEGF